METDKHNHNPNNERTRKKSMPTQSESPILLPWLGCLVWPLIVTVPLVLTAIPGPGSGLTYAELFPKSWYHYDGLNPKPLGLCLGILAVAVGQAFVLLYFYLHKHGFLGSLTAIQAKGAPQYEWSEGILTHLGQPEGFVLLGLYLSITWMFHLMPRSYYSFQGTIQWPETMACLILQDFFQFGMHRLEHVVSPWFYRMSHKPHHKFTNPRLFDAFNGSMTDTICMILIPLYCTAMIVRNANVWTYMAFGSLYANWLTMIHSEYAFPWDGLFRFLGLGTPGDHHVHHKFFKFNYGHLFMWFDQLFGSYKGPQHFARGAFNKHV
jgi:sterol desaturase/sphingolipid hydroxylase (fatty acid hydroxylase superfamily)